MAYNERRGENQKLKLLYLAKIFSEETDDHHALTMAEIIKKLEDCGVHADRKTLYLDFEELRHFGYDVIADKEGRSCYYHLGDRDFELPELKLLVDAVQSSKFITDRKSNELIRKLESLVSRHEAKQLHRQVITAGRVKTMNESIYYNVDELHEAILADRQIRFKYYQWTVEKKMEFRKEGAWYQVSPWGLMWDDENYYLVAYDAGEDKIKHYRVDKMYQISSLPDRRLGKKEFNAFNMPRYSRSLFGMFGGEEIRVTIEAENSLAGVLIDRFGKDILIMRTDENHFRTVVDVVVSKQFLGWIMALGDGIKITAPDSVVHLMKEEIRRLANQYDIKFE